MEPEADGLDDFDYKNTDLNKCSEYELKKHKKKMEENFMKNQLKPGDAGFQYDKRVKFDYEAEELEENSWDEDEEDIDSDEYDRKTGGAKHTSKTALELAMEKAMAAANMDGDYDDEDYFDDDFA